MNLKHLGAWSLAGLMLLSGTRAAAGSLEEALERLASDDVLIADSAVEEIVRFGAPAVDSLLVRVDSPQRDIRAGAIRGLGLLQDRKAAPVLRQMLQRSLDAPGPDTMESRYFRILLIQAVGRLKDPEATELLKKAAASSDPFERAHAAVSLVVTGADPGYDLVHASVTDHDPAIRALAAEGLGETSDERARSLLLELTRDEAWVVRDAAYRSLGRFRDDAAVREALERGTHDPSWYVRQTASEAAAGSRR